MDHCHEKARDKNQLNTHLLKLKSSRSVVTENLPDEFIINACYEKYHSSVNDTYNVSAVNNCAGRKRS